MNAITLLCLVGSLALAAPHPSPPIAPLMQLLQDNKQYSPPAENFEGTQEDPQHLSYASHPLQGYPWEDQLNYDEAEADDDYDSSEHVFIRNKRQARDLALDLALSHQDRNGNDRPVGKPHGRVDLFGVGQDSRNYHVNGGAGLGSVVWRSNNKRHSIGVGAYGSQGRGRFQGFGYKTRPDFGAGIGYRFRF